MDKTNNSQTHSVSFFISPIPESSKNVDSPLSSPINSSCFSPQLSERLPSLHQNSLQSCHPNWILHKNPIESEIPMITRNGRTNSDSQINEKEMYHTKSQTIMDSNQGNISNSMMFDFSQYDTVMYPSHLQQETYQILTSNHITSDTLADTIIVAQQRAKNHEKRFHNTTINEMKLKVAPHLTRHQDTNKLDFYDY
jgi:hypothetical protein